MTRLDTFIQMEALAPAQIMVGNLTSSSEVDYAPKTPMYPNQPFVIGPVVTAEALRQTMDNFAEQDNSFPSIRIEIDSETDRVKINQAAEPIAEQMLHIGSFMKLLGVAARSLTYQQSAPIEHDFNEMGEHYDGAQPRLLMIQSGLEGHTTWFVLDQQRQAENERNKHYVGHVGARNYVELNASDGTISPAPVGAAVFFTHKTLHARGPLPEEGGRLTMLSRGFMDLENTDIATVMEPFYSKQLTDDTIIR